MMRTSAFLFRPALWVLVCMALAGCRTSPDSEESASVSFRAGAAETTRSAFSAADSNSAEPPPVNGGKPPALDAALVSKVEQELAAEGVPTSGPILNVSGTIAYADGRPATSATVQVVRMEWNDAQGTPIALTGNVAREPGRFQATVADGTRLRLLVSAPGVPETLWMIDPPLPERPSEVRKLERHLRLPAPARLDGRVVADSGEAVGGAHVTARMNASSTMTTTEVTVLTASDGSFSFDPISAGPGTLVAESEEHVPTALPVEAPAENVLIRFPAYGGTVEGGVYDYFTREGLSSVTVTLSPGFADKKAMPFHPSKVVTDATGSFRFSRLPRGQYQMTARRENLIPVPAGNPNLRYFDLGEGATTSGIELFLYPGHTVTGIVTEQGTTIPLAGVKLQTITHHGAVVNAETGADGTYKLGPFAPRNWHATLEIEKPGYELAYLDVPRSMMSRDTIGIDAKPDQLEIERDITLMAKPTVSGRVLNEEGQPVEGAKVQSSPGRTGQAATAVSGADGEYEVTVDTETIVVIMAKAPEFAPGYSRSIPMRTKPFSGVDIVLKRTADVSGVVVDEAGVPVAGAKVLAQYETLRLQRNHYFPNEAPYANTISGTDGSFLLKEVNPEDITLYATASGWPSSRPEELFLAPGEHKSDVRLVFGKPHFLAGRITDREGKPVPDAEISASSLVSRALSASKGKSDTEGRYQLENIAGAEVRVTIQAAGFSAKEIERVATDRDDADFVMGSEYSVKLIGTVVDASTGKPVPGIQVSSVRAIHEKGMDPKLDPSRPGGFTAWLSPIAEASFSISAEGYPPISTSYFRIPPGVSTLERTFRIGQGGTVTGRVVSAEDRSPLAGVKIGLPNIRMPWSVQTEKDEEEVVTGADGRFRADNLLPGLQELMLLPEPPRVRLMRKVHVAYGVTSDLGDIEVGGGGRVRGRIFHASTGEPIAGATIELSANSSAKKLTASGEDGSFQFTGLSNSSYSVGAPDHQAATFFSISGNELKTVELPVGFGKLVGLVTEGGKPVRAGVTYSLQDADQSLRRSGVNTGSDGKFVLEDLTPGNWLVAVDSLNSRNSHSGWVMENVEIVAGQTVEREFIIPKGTITGRVLDASGEPVAEAVINLSWKQSRPPSGVGWESSIPGPTTSAEDGSFSFDHLPAGSGSLTAAKEGEGQAFLPELAYDGSAAPAPVELKLRGGDGGTLISTVLEIQSGAPLKDAWCYLYSDEGQYVHSAVRDETGVMTVTNVPPGRYRVEVGQQNYTVAENMVTVEAGKRVELTDVLEPAGSIIWQLQDSSRKALAGVACRLTEVDGTAGAAVREGRTAGNGMVSWSHLPPGRYEATAEVAGAAVLRETFEVEAFGHVSRVTRP